MRRIVFGGLLLTVVAVAPAIPGSSRSPSAIYSDSGLEAQLVRVYAEIEKNRLDKALNLTESLLYQYPTFRLGHLIKGDLLLARSRPISNLGNADNAPADRLAGLRDEAVARLKAYQHKPAADAMPRYLMQLQPDQKYAIVVDTQKARLYLYQNKDGQPRFVADYYISHGKLGADKTREGDKKTPTGVYHVTASLPREKLTDFYGTGAFPINYPNEWDKRLGRSGHGIWLHGTPPDTFSRPPKASDGCVVLANADLDALAKNLQPGLTPVIISNQIEWLSHDDWQNERNALKHTLDEWRRDWESRDTDRFLRHYSRKFRAGSQGLEAFSQQKRQVNAGKEWIKVRTDNVSMFRDPGKDELVVVSFEQDYRSNNLTNKMKKLQYWIREDGSWKIVYEGAA